MADSPLRDEGPDTTGGINTPNLSESGKVQRKAIRDAKQASSIYENHEKANRDRNEINAKIIQVYNGKQPRDPHDLERNNQTWQSNFPVLFLKGIIDKVVPTLTSFIENAKYLTQAKLKDESEEGIKKTETYRRLLTKYARRWEGWRPFYSSLCNEIILIGYAAGGRTDEYEWRPTFWRQDQARLSEGTPQFANRIQVLTIEQDMMISEATDIIQDKEAAKLAGWNIENMIEAINKANPRDDSQGGASNPRAFEDTIREGNIGASYSTGAKVVKMGHVLAVETGEEGKVTQYIVNRDEAGKELFKKENRFDSIQDIVTLFTLEPGNSKYYGSIGLGRTLVNYDRAINAVTNSAVDALKLGGLIIIKQDMAKGMPNPRVKSPFLWVHPDATFEQKASFQTKSENYILLINKLYQMAEIAAQQYVPNTFDDELEATATEKRIDYTRELQSKAAFISRFAGQFADMIGGMQRAIGNPETNDEEAKAFQAELKEADISEKELKELSESPAAEIVQDLTQQDNMAVVQGTSDPELQMSSMIDQKKRLDMKLVALFGVTRAKELLLQEAIDPTEEVEQVRAQIGENEDILNGASVPISPRDNDEVHLKVLIPDMMKGAQALQQNPEAASQDPSILDHHNAGLVHGAAHVDNWKKKGAAPQQTAPYEQALAQGEQMLAQFAEQLREMQAQKQAEAEQAQQQEMQQAPPEEEMPVGTEEQPLPFTEKVAVAWIGQFQNLTLPERTRLLELTGVLTPYEASVKQVDEATLDNSQPIAEDMTMAPPPVVSEQSFAAPPAPEPIALEPEPIPSPPQELGTI